MKEVTRQKTVDYKVYVAKDGQEFTSLEDCQHHEKILDGTRIVCPECHGKGRWQTGYVPEHEHWEGTLGGYWTYETCPKCGGKGWLEKKVTWE